MSMKTVHRYRRKEANARERQRQGEINTGFDKLREKIPHPGPSNGKCEKLRKIDILHVAIEYIRYTRQKRQKKHKKDKKAIEYIRYIVKLGHQVGLSLCQ